MKSLLFALILVTGAANAATVIPLQRPPSLVQQAVNNTQLYCAQDGFNADDTVHGYCELYTSYGRSTNRVAYYYQVSWDDAGLSTVGPFCATLPRYSTTFVYQPGFNAANCTDYLKPNGVVEINGTYYYYLSTSTDGAYELVPGDLVKF